MATKSKIKTKKKVKAKSKAAVKNKKLKKTNLKPVMKAKPKKKTGAKKTKVNKKVTPAPKKSKKITAKGKSAGIALTPANVPISLTTKTAPPVKPVVLTVKRVINPLVPRKPIKRSQRANQYTYMKPPGLEHEYEVSDTVEVFCDHDKNRDRIRGWVKGIVVQVDHKMVAVQFRSNVYLTDGWMVPDRILWYPVNSEHIRPMAGKKIVKKDFIPDY